MLLRECDVNRPVEYTETWVDSTGGYGESHTYYEPSTTTSCNTKSHCWHMLPCGICRITNLPCHYGGYDKWEITC